MKDLLPPFSTKLFLGTSKHRSHIHETSNPESYLQSVDKKNTLLRRTHRVYEILPGSKEICCYGTLFPVVSCSEELKTCQNTRPFVTMLINLYLLCSGAYSDVSINASHEEGLHQRKCSTNIRYGPSTTPKQHSMYTQMYPHLI